MQHTIETIRLGTSGLVIEREYRGGYQHKLTVIVETPKDRTMFGDVVSAPPEDTLQDILNRMGEDAAYVDMMEARLNRGLRYETGLAQLVRDYYAQEDER